MALKAKASVSLCQSGLSLFVVRKIAVPLTFFKVVSAVWLIGIEGVLLCSGGKVSNTKYV